MRTETGAGSLIVHHTGWNPERERGSTVLRGALDVLYDRQGTAEYFQAYTKDFDGGFFFEIVQRRGYAGFGAANAPIRLAAQTRLARHPAIPRR